MKRAERKSTMHRAIGLTRTTVANAVLMTNAIQLTDGVDDAKRRSSSATLAGQINTRRNDDGRKIG